MTGPVGALPRVVVASVRGAVHERDGLPNQDAVARSGPGEDGVLIVAVADGHGSHKAFRSDAGARLAVDVAVDCGLLFADRIRQAGAAGFEGGAGAPLAEAVVDRWTTAVRADLAAAPLLDHELAALEASDGAAARLAVESDPGLAYGATLLLAVVVESFAAFLQLGDGDILAVSAVGAASRVVADDPRLLGNETTSLCMAGAQKEFRFAARPLAEDGAQVFLLATDGLANAYPDEDSFLRVGSDLLDRIRTAGLDALPPELGGYLREASVHSGDDVTVAVIWVDPSTADQERGWPPLAWPTVTS